MIYNTWKQCKVENSIGKDSNSSDYKRFQCCFVKSPLICNHTIACLLIAIEGVCTLTSIMQFILHSNDTTPHLISVVLSFGTDQNSLCGTEKCVLLCLFNTIRKPMTVKTIALKNVPSLWDPSRS